MSTHPKRVDKFRAWAKLMMEQALVPDRVSYGQRHGAVAPTMAPRAAGKKSRRRRKRRKRRNQDG